jgi:hypothetical protein
MRAAAVLLVVTTLSALALAGPLATDPNAYIDPNTNTPVQGTKTLSASDGQGNTLSATIDYCVYGPGSFSYGSYTTFAGTKIPAANEFTYAYQVTTVGGTELMSSLWVNMIDSNEATDVGQFALSSGVVPDDWYFAGTYPTLNTANWDFYPPNLAVGDGSCGLAYVSVNAPTWQMAGWIQDGGLSASELLPSPSDVIPEPATILLLAGSAIGLLRRGR